MGLRSREDSLKLATNYVKTRRMLLNADLAKMDVDQVIEKHWNVLIGMDAIGDRRWGFVNRSSLRQAILSIAKP